MFLADDECAFVSVLCFELNGQSSKQHRRDIIRCLNGDSLSVFVYLVFH